MATSYEYGFIEQEIRQLAQTGLASLALKMRVVRCLQGCYIMSMGWYSSSLIREMEQAFSVTMVV